MKQYFAFQWHITDECDQRCKHCYIFSDNNCKVLDSMSWEQIQSVFDNFLEMKEISVKELTINPMTMISDEWLLITAGSKESGYNTMTACWGHMGAIWGHGKGLPTAVVYVRPQRYTKEFLDHEKLFTLFFFPKEYKKQLGYLGTHSGRNENKIKNTGLTPLLGYRYTYFSEAKMTLVCRKLYHAPLMESGFTDRTVMEDNYPERDFHDMYIGEIIQVFV